MANVTSLRVVCCFCYEPVPAAGDEPVALYARGARDESEQSFWAHLTCFKRALHPQVPIGVAILSEPDEPAAGGDGPADGAQPKASWPAV